jgi:hypothetical protein
MPDIKHIFALDPGLTSGWTTYDVMNRSFTAGESNFDQTCANLLEFVTNYGPAGLIVCESFMITVHTAKNTQAPWSLELIGVARMIARRWTGNELLLQTPAQAKAFSTNNRLKHVGFWTPGMAGHANDAARHLLLVLVNRGYLPKEILAELVDIV